MFLLSKGLLPAARSQMFPTPASAAVMQVLGLSGLIHHEDRSSITTCWHAREPELDQLYEREATPHVRRGIQDLLGAFMRAQLIRHHWGQFASSSTEHGLVADPSLEAGVVNSAGITQLWLTPRRGQESCFFQVRSSGGNLLCIQCHGQAFDSDKAINIEVKGNECPSGCTSLRS